MAFFKLQIVGDSDITNAIIESIKRSCLSLSQLPCQGYDGASAVSGHKAGVQKVIRDIEAKEISTYCAGYSLNLGVLSSCGVTPIRNCIDEIRSFTP